MYYLKNGLIFERQEGGNVGIYIRARDAFERCFATTEGADPYCIAVVTPEEWASVVAAMSADGETSHSYNEALDHQLHKTKEPR